MSVIPPNRMRSMTFIHYFLPIVLASLASFCSPLEEFRCKAVPGCEISAQCDPSPFSSESLNRNEFPIKCVSDDARKEKINEDEMKAVLRILKDLTEDFSNEHKGILYNGTCLWEEEKPEKLTLTNAYKKCNSVTPSKLPEFYNKEQYNQLMDFLRSKIPSGETSIRIWIGLTRNHWTGKAVLFNGESAPYDKIMDEREQWKDGSQDRTNAYIYAGKSPASIYDGMGATTPAHTFQDRVVTLLCQTLPFSSESNFKTNEEKVWCQSIGGIAYNGSCLWAEDPPDDMTLSRASEVCNERTPSKLPEVYGGHQYIEIMEYMRTKIKTIEIYAWTAMIRDILTNQAMLSDGTYAPYTKVRPYSEMWENAKDDKINVYLVSRPDSASLDQGMGSMAPTYSFEREQKIVICQKL